nr:ribonuclease H-like domain-containing protein [Tanacetum cinerariifolium]
MAPDPILCAKGRLGLIRLALRLPASVAVRIHCLVVPLLLLLYHHLLEESFIALFTCFIIVIVILEGNPQHALKDKGVINSGCSWHMTGNITYLSDFQKLNGGYVAFGGNSKGGKITCKGKIKTVLTKSKPVSVTTARPVSVAVPKIMATK